MKFISVFLCTVLCVCTLSGCSLVPVPVKHHAREQNKFRSVSHWNDLSLDVAGEISKAVGDLWPPGTNVPPLYIVRNGNSQFSEAFYEMLETSLVRMGRSVSNKEYIECIHVECDVLIFLHDKGYDGYSGGYIDGVPAAVGAGVASLLVGPFESTSNNEVVVTSAARYGDRYILKNTTPYYVHDADIGMYMKRKEGVKPFRSVKIPAQNG